MVSAGEAGGWGREGCLRDLQAALHSGIYSTQLFCPGDLTARFLINGFVWFPALRVIASAQHEQ